MDPQNLTTGQPNIAARKIGHVSRLMVRSEQHRVPRPASCGSVMAFPGWLVDAWQDSSLR